MVLVAATASIAQFRQTLAPHEIDYVLTGETDGALLRIEPRSGR
jgi:hypothetical protein